VKLENSRFSGFFFSLLCEHGGFMRVWSFLYRKKPAALIGKVLQDVYAEL
jgi:hypothetical protein